MKKIPFLISILLFSFYSCSDFLEQEPDEQVSIKQQLATKEGVLQAYNGIYRDLEAILSGNFAVYADLLGGNITFTPVISNKEISIPAKFLNTYSFNSKENKLDFETFYEDCYDLINQTNVLLENNNSFIFLSSEENNQLKAELLTVRATAHYLLTLLFAQNYNFTVDASHLGVVYNTNTVIAGVDFPARKTMAETYTLLQQDLENALQLYQNIQLLGGLEVSYFSVISTQALYAKIALQMNDYPKALEYANKVITSSYKVLLTKNNYILEWEKTEAPVLETILEFSAPRNSSGAVSSSLANSFFGYNSNQNYKRHVASGDLLSLYSTNDIRADLFLEQQLETEKNGNVALESYFFTKKYQVSPGTLFIRLSEIYLIRAEANARLNNTANALADLNIIRERANLLAINNTNNLLEEIFLERRRELAFEGHLFFDIARYKKDVIRDLGCIATVCNLSYPSNFFILPIPFASVSLNQNIKQNEGY
ncbi:RagB/SusD family nutrient uptake outer membrane protein [Polaribacter cellanae]|uniref:RagB/SusD family nutrient uptake outer membrane protein n=1 Tax=Polaribacter cellanae TaxID=2818493 RepID=A0A975CPE9_9FLAO|nr:RagB/SusD family nutrient uptake outer membrane protein [Polaribacter cellanae]QTE21432.1 RagB/SusD family nutrient uptake outer membrane protein [Polaribacter cellanae]